MMTILNNNKGELVTLSDRERELVNQLEARLGKSVDWERIDNHYHGPGYLIQKESTNRYRLYYSNGHNKLKIYVNIVEEEKHSSPTILYLYETNITISQAECILLNKFTLEEHRELGTVLHRIYKPKPGSGCKLYNNESDDIKIYYSESRNEAKLYNKNVELPIPGIRIKNLKSEKKVVRQRTLKEACESLIDYELNISERIAEQSKFVVKIFDHSDKYLHSGVLICHPSSSPNPLLLTVKHGLQDCIKKDTFVNCYALLNNGKLLLFTKYEDYASDLILIYFKEIIKYDLLKPNFEGDTHHSLFSDLSEFDTGFPSILDKPVSDIKGKYLLRMGFGVGTMLKVSLRYRNEYIVYDPNIVKVGDKIFWHDQVESSVTKVDSKKALIVSENPRGSYSYEFNGKNFDHKKGSGNLKILEDRTFEDGYIITSNRTREGCSGDPVFLYDGNAFKLIGLHLGVSVRDSILKGFCSLLDQKSIEFPLPKGLIKHFLQDISKMGINNTELKELNEFFPIKTFIDSLYKLFCSCNEFKDWKQHSNINRPAKKDKEDTRKSAFTNKIETKMETYIKSRKEGTYRGKYSSTYHITYNSKHNIWFDWDKEKYKSGTIMVRLNALGIHRDEVNAYDLYGFPEFLDNINDKFIQNHGTPASFFQFPLKS